MGKLIRKFLDAPAPDAGKPPAEAAEIVFRASDDTPDRYGDRVFVQGMDLTAYNANPILLMGHNHGAPVGKAKVWVEGNELLMAPTFTEATATARECAQMVKDGTLRTVSIGFRPKPGGMKENEHGGWDFVESELLEISFVAVPANPNALRVKSMKPTTKVSTLARGLAALLEKAAKEAEEQEEEKETPEEEEEPKGKGKKEDEPETPEEEEPKGKGKGKGKNEGGTCPHCGEELSASKADEEPEEEEPAEEPEEDSEEEPEDKDDTEEEVKQLFALLSR